MKNLFSKKIPSHINNERGVAALVSIILAIIVIGSVAFNFVAETRQKQAGSILTYTSTNALMIAEAGLRLTQKCLTDEDAAWGCPAILQGNSDWLTITSGDNFSRDFGGDGTFDISFPVSTLNDSGKIFVTSSGTFREGKRSLSRFITRSCVLGTNAVTSCTATTTKNNSYIDPPLPDPPPTTECPDDPPGIVGEFEDDDDCTGCNGSSSLCPDFDTNLHLDGGNWLDAGATKFCDFKMDNSDEVKTHAGNHASIYIHKKLEIKDNATLILNDDADPGNVFTVPTPQNNKLNVTGTPYALNDVVVLTTTGTLPAGLSDSTQYYVVNIASGKFQLSLTASGSAVNITDAGTPTHTVTKVAVGTTILVFQDAKLQNNGEIQVKGGTLTLNINGKFEMKNSSKVNNIQGEAADASAWVEKDVQIKNSSLFVGSITSDQKIELKNNAEVQGSLFGNEVKLKNNASVIYTDNEDAGGNTDGYAECAAGGEGQVWSE